jgi:hypothetical protein
LIYVSFDLVDLKEEKSLEKERMKGVEMLSGVEKRCDLGELFSDAF